MTLLKQAMVAILGAALLLAIVLVWRGLTGWMTLLIERAWCWNASLTDACRLRGSSLFLVWAVVGLVNIVIIGFVIERLNDRLRRRR
jgi:hypothetical protein